LGLKFFDTARYLNRPPVVTEVASDLAHHRRDREGEKLDASVDVEAVHGVDQADSGSLDEVVERLTAATISMRDVIGKRQTTLDDGFALRAKFERPLIEQLEAPEHL
jgi:hypothetical protein